LGGVQAVLDVALAASGSYGKKMRKQGITRTHFPHGLGEQNMGCATRTRRTENPILEFCSDCRLIGQVEGASCALLVLRGARFP
jgi:hypothetical protein